MPPSIPKLCPHCFYYPKKPLRLGVLCLNCDKDTRITPKFEETVERIIDLKKQNDDLISKYQSLSDELISVKNDIKERKEGLQVAGLMVVFIIVLVLPIYFDWTPGLHHLF